MGAPNDFDLGRFLRENPTPVKCRRVGCSYRVTWLIGWCCRSCRQDGSHGPKCSTCPPGATAESVSRTSEEKVPSCLVKQTPTDAEDTPATEPAAAADSHQVEKPAPPGQASQDDFIANVPQKPSTDEPKQDTGTLTALAGTPTVPADTDPHTKEEEVPTPEEDDDLSQAEKSSYMSVIRQELIQAHSARANGPAIQNPLDLHIESLREVLSSSGQAFDHAELATVKQALQILHHIRSPTEPPAPSGAPGPENGNRDDQEDDANPWVSISAGMNLLDMD